MIAFFRDLRYSVRSLRRTPGLTVMLVATVAVGIGTHAALSGFTNGLLARSVSAAGGHRVAVIQWHAGKDRELPVPFDAFARLRSPSPSFDAVAERVAWWTEIFEVPCVAYAGNLAEVEALARLNAEFVAVADDIWRSPRTMIDAVTTAAEAVR